MGVTDLAFIIKEVLDIIILAIKFDGYAYANIVACVVDGKLSKTILMQSCG